MGRLGTDSRTNSWRLYISRHRNILVTELFLKSLIKLYGKHTGYSDGGPWYAEACDSLGLEHTQITLTI